MKKLNVLMHSRRKELGLTQHDLAQKVGLGQGWISEIERCRRQPSVRKAKELAAILGLNWTDFYLDQEAYNANAHDK